MNIEIVAGSLFVCLAVIFLLYGVKLLTKRDINLSQFTPGYQGNKTIDVVTPKPYKEEIALNKRVFLILIGGTTIAIVSYAVIGIFWVSACTAFLGLTVPHFWLKWQDTSKERLVASQLEQAVEIMGSVIRSGSGITSALRRAAQTVGNPLNNELIQTASEIELGVSNADAFKNLAERVPMQETGMLSMVMDIQHTGMAINLASVFGQIQQNIRNKQALQEEVKAITVENKLAGWIVAAVPFVTIGIIRWTAPDFTAPLFSTPIGLFIFLISTGLIIGGVLWIMKMANMSDF